MKKMIFLGNFLALIVFGNAQQHTLDCTSYINNDSIKYDIYRTLKKNSNQDPNGVVFYIVQIEMSKKMKKHFEKKDTSFWIEKLTNNSSDWAANLILYYIYERDAFSLIMVKKRDDWLSIRSKEIEYWKRFLTK